MNYKTLTQGSIVNFEDELWGVEVISHTNKKLTLHNLNGDTANQPFYMINPVPITPELLECLGFLSHGVDFSGDKYSYCYNNEIIIIVSLNELEDDELDICTSLDKGILLSYEKQLTVHKFQHFLRGIDGLKFEITLDKLKDLKS